MTETLLPLVEIYTDGACSGNPGPGGWGVYLIFKQHDKITTKKLSGHSAHTTSNKMELSAAIAALNCLKRKCKVVLYTDSTYLQQGITNWIKRWRMNNWRNSTKENVKNAELWKELDQAAAKHQIDWHWVKGHAGIIGNEIADQLAVAASKEAKNNNKID